MEDKGVEKRVCKRFEIPGATISYKVNKKSEEFCPVIDISRGGIKFLGKKSLDINTELTLQISIPGETIPLSLIGVVRWLSYDDEKEKYNIGIQFNPYGEKKDQNYPGIMVKIIALEQKFSTQDVPRTEKFKIET